MKVNGTLTRTTIWVEAPPAGGRPGRLGIIDQTRLPDEYGTITLKGLEDTDSAISDVLVCGAPPSGATAAYGMALAMRGHASGARLSQAHEVLRTARPTAINLTRALADIMRLLNPLPHGDRELAAWPQAAAICDEHVEIWRMIGILGLELIREIAKERPVHVLTRCNAGWLARVDRGTASAPVHEAHDAATDVHVWVDETRPRNERATLTEWEQANHEVPHLMQHGTVVIVGTDRTTASGDVCNNTGTYLKPPAVAENGGRVYVARRFPTTDFRFDRGLDVPIEQRSSDEVSWVHGRDPEGLVPRMRSHPEASPMANFAFDVTPEWGLLADLEAIAALLPDRAAA